MARDPLGLYDDCITIPFKIPLEVTARGNPQAVPAEFARSPGAAWQAHDLPASEAGHPQPPALGSRGGAATQRSSPNDGIETNSVVGEWPTVPDAVIAWVPHHPDLVVASESDGTMTLWRCSHGRPDEALATLRRDHDELWDLRGAFAGLLEPDQTAGLHPDWLASIGAETPAEG